MNELIKSTDLPNLEFLTMWESALFGDFSIDRRANSTIPYYYKNTLTMRSTVSNGIVLIDLPSLTTIRGDKTNFGFIGSVVLESSLFGD